MYYFVVEMNELESNLLKVGIICKTWEIVLRAGKSAE